MKNTLTSVLVIVLGILVVVEGAMLLGLHRPYTANGKDAENGNESTDFGLLDDGFSSSRMSTSQASPQSPHASPPQAGQVRGWDPFAEIERMQKQMDAMMKQANKHAQNGGTAGNSFVMSFPDAGVDAVPDIALNDDGGAYRCTLAVPNVDEKTLQVSVEDNILRVAGVRTTENTQEQGGHVVAHIRHTEQFTRSLELSGPTDPLNVKTSYKDGVLTVVVPKAPDQDLPPLAP